MIIAIDTNSATLRVTDDAGERQYPLFGPEAFRILSRQWLILGWNLHHSFTFSFMGRQFIQLPDDMLRLGELMWCLRPDVILETGVYEGGSTLFWATLCRMRTHGRVISIEKHFRPGVREAILEAAGDIVTLIDGDASSPEIAAQIRSTLHSGDRVCVHLDSDHSAQHVAAELELLGPLVSPGCYMVVADSNLSDVAHTPRGRAFGLTEGPAQAVDAFLATHPEFRRERPTPLFPEEFDFTELSYCATTWLKRYPMSSDAVENVPALLATPAAPSGLPAGTSAEDRRLALAIDAWKRDFTGAVSTYRGQRAWKAMLAICKVYDVLARGTWKQRAALLGWIPGFLLGRSSGLEEYDLKFPDPAVYLDRKANDAHSSQR
jgi:cephalosporin hydroxylase